MALTAPVRNTLVEVDEGGNALAWHLAPHFLQLLTPQVYSKAKFMELASAGNMKRTWCESDRRAWLDAREGEGRAVLRQATQVTNSWIPYGE